MFIPEISLPCIINIAQMMLMREQMERNMHQAFADTGAFTP